MAAPGCTLEAWKEIQQDPLLDLIILNDVYLRKKLNPVGRPALAADDKRHTVKMTDAEWQRIQEKAKAAGMSTRVYQVKSRGLSPGSFYSVGLLLR